MYTTDAIALRTVPFGEADELVSFYTKDYGKLVIKAKSSKKFTTKQGRFLHEPSALRCSFVLSRTGYILSGINNIRGYSAISGDILARGYVSSFLSLCDELFYEGQKDESIWNLLISVFEDADFATRQAADKEKALWRAEKMWLASLLSALGHKTDEVAIENARNFRHIDIYFKNMLQDRLERKVEFFGLKAAPKFNRKSYA